MSVIAQLAIFPLDRTGSLSPYVAKAVGIIKASGLPYALGPMGTCLEGEWREVMDVVECCFEALEADSNRVYLTLSVDYRAGRQGGLTAKTVSVAALLED